MGSMEKHSGNAMSTTLHYHQITDMLRSPRGTVLRIEAFSLVAIALSFFLAAFGSCRRWSNSWIIQKGFLAAQVLSLSLGTYSIGLMQSSSVKSEMYTIWAVSLLTLFGCVDPISTYIGLDYKGPFLKVIFQLCLYCGYVMLMSIPTISGVVGNLSIGVLSAITFIKGFHRSLALVLQSNTRNQLGVLESTEPYALAGDGKKLLVQLPVIIKLEKKKENKVKKWVTRINMDDIQSSCNKMVQETCLGVTANDKTIIEDACLGYSLSHLLQRRFLRLDTARELEEKRSEFEYLAKGNGRDINYKRTLKAVEVELAFLYEVFFTSNEFLHYNEAKTSSFWALASFLGICFVGVAAAIPGTMASSRHGITSSGPGAVTVVVDTTIADLIITLVILVSLALLQLVQLIRCWASNWARVTFACEYAKTRPGSKVVESETFTFGSGFSVRTNEVVVKPSWWPGMRLKAFLATRINWFDRWLWQDQLGQYSIVDAASSRREGGGGSSSKCLQMLPLRRFVGCGYYYWIRDSLPGILGLQYIALVLRELLAVSDMDAERLHGDVKASIADFLAQKIKSGTISKEWSSLFAANGIDASQLPYSNASLELGSDLEQGFLASLFAKIIRPDAPTGEMSSAYAFTHRVIMWHIATWYCEKAEQQQGGGAERHKNRRVALYLSKYCAYLVVSAPELLPGPSAETKRAFQEAMSTLLHRQGKVEEIPTPHGDDAVSMGVHWGKKVLGAVPDDPWELLALLWVQTVLYAAPYGDVQAHMQHLSQGGEFITHLWALLYHLGIDKWEHPEEDAQEAKKEGGGGGETVVDRKADRDKKRRGFRLPTIRWPRLQKKKKKNR